MVFGLLPAANAQTGAATVTGTVVDSTGAAMPGASVKVSNTASGQVRETQTNSSGSYSVPLLQPGVYNLTISKEGFATAERTSITLLVDQVATIDLSMQVGTLGQVIEVGGQTQVLETATASQGNVITEKTMVDLPLNGRQITQLLTLGAGVVPLDISQNNYTRPQLGAGALIPSINGQPNRSNLFFLDGAYATDPFFTGFAISPSVDAMQEFKAQSHADLSEFGGAMGGVVNMVSKSGTNEFHGAMYEFLRNADLEARGFFPATKGAYKQNQFGATLGGPILRNKLFFFGYYDGYRSVQAASSLVSVPTAAQIGGNFAGSNPIFNPYTAVPNPAKPGSYLFSPFPNNVIPTSLLNPGIQAVLKALVPLPNYSGAGVNYINTQSKTINQDQGGVRIDYQVGQKDSLFGRYSLNNETQLAPNNLATTPFQTQFNSRNATASWIHSFSPTLIAQGTVAYNYLQIPQQYVTAGNVDQLFQTAGFGAGFPEKPGGIQINTIPTMTVTGYFTAQQGWGPIGPMNVGQESGSVSKVAGNHDLKFGAAFYKTWLYTNWANNSETYTSQNTADPTNPSSTGNAVASLVLGTPFSAGRSFGDSSVAVRMTEIGLYVQDSWKISPKLTINYGLRWDYTSPVSEKYNRESVFDVYTGQWILAKGNRDAPSTLPPGVVELSRNTIISPNYDNFQPRLGFAYRILPKTVIRSGGGMFFDNWSEAIQMTQGPRGAWPSGSQQSPTNLNLAGVTATAQNPFTGLPGGIPTTPFPSSSGALDPRWKNAYSVQWNFEIQQELSNDSSFSVAYVGARDNRLMVSLPSNYAQPGPGAVNPRRPYAQPYGNVLNFSVPFSIGRAHYESLQLRYNKRFSKGLNVFAAYTWSKNIDIGCSDDGCSIQNPSNLHLERGLAAVNIPQVFVLSWDYALPFGRGAKYLNRGGPVGWLVSGWQVNGITQARDGQAVTPTINFDNANNGGSNQRPNIVGNPSLSNPTVQQWFNTSAFKVAAPYTFGNAGRNIIRGPNYVDFDVSVLRNFRITERTNLQFRSEFYNVFNHPNFNPPGAQLGTSTFGVITSTLPPRDIQMALKLTF